MRDMICPRCNSGNIVKNGTASERKNSSDSRIRWNMVICREQRK